MADGYLDAEKVMSPERYAEAKLASYWDMKFKESMVAKAPYTKNWNMFWDSYRGDYLKNTSKPEYKSDLVSNYIFSIIETIRPIMLDNDPKFQAMPRHPEGTALSNDLQEALSYEWDREYMRSKLFRELITTLVTGTSVIFQPWDSVKKEVRAIFVNPFNIFPDPLATSVDDAEYMIYASYKNVEVLRRMFPQYRDRLVGADVNYGELVHNNNQNAKIDNQILILEVWTRDYESKDEKGQNKYPNGRVITVCPEIGIVLSDKKNPYKDGKFPFEIIKDYDVPGKFWGEGEVAQLLSPQKEMNELNNAILDTAKTSANAPWILDKNSGIAEGKITSRPGLVLRKTPGSEVRREQPPQMPAYIPQAVDSYKSDMEQISGVFDTLKGNSETGVYTAQGILALQEAGQARIRLKVKLLEESLGRIATKWLSRMRQFWTDERYVRVTHADGSYDVKSFNKKTFDFDFDVRITAGSTMPVNRGAMLDLMVRLAQTPMPDGQNIVDREAVVQYLPEEVKSSMLQRMGQTNTQLTQQVTELQQQLEQFMAQDQQDDQGTMSALEQITSSIEDLSQKVLQMEEHGAKMEEARKKEEERTKIKETSYNEGYRDAETINQPEQPVSQDSEFTSEGLGEDPEMSDSLPMPDDIISGMDEMTDEELELLLETNPELSELLPE